MKYLNALFGIIAILICANVSAAPLDVSGTYTAEISYSSETPMADRKWFFGANPDIEITLTQKGDKISGEISDDRDGTIKGKIDDEEITFEFYLEALGGEIKDGAGTWTVKEDGTLNGDFKIRDQRKGIVRGYWILTALPGPAQETGKDVQIEWLTWSFFRITSPEGKVILTNPWITNPDSRITLEQVNQADIILVPTGHRDEVGETVEVANKTKAKVVTTWEMAGGAFKGKIPNDQLIRTQPGSSVNVGAINIRVVGAVHGSGGKNALYGGPALGFIITFENGYRLYFSGSTDVTMDMQLWGSLFKPDAAILYYPGSMDPNDVAHMARLLSTDNPGLRTIIPHHHRVKAAPGKSVEALGEALKKLGVSAKLLNPEPGTVYTLSN